MHRVDTPTELYTDGDETQDGTILSAAETNTWQEELCNVVEDDGISLDPNNDHQVSERITARIGTHAALNVVTNNAHGYVIPFSETYGCVLSNNTSDADHDIDISAGRRCSDDGAVNMVLAAAMTKRIDAAWAAGTNQGGLDAGSVAANTWYHVFQIKNPTSGAVDVLFSTSLSSPTMPSGYTKKRLLESRLTDGAANIIKITQRGDFNYWETPPLDVDTAISYTMSSLTISVPPRQNIEAICNVYPYCPTGEVVHLYGPYETNNPPSNLGSPLFSFDIPSDGNGVGGRISIPVNPSAQVRARSQNGSVTLHLATIGWHSDRGRS